MRSLARLADDHDVATLTFAREAGPEGPLASLGERIRATRIRRLGDRLVGGLSAALADARRDARARGHPAHRRPRERPGGRRHDRRPPGRAGIPVYPVLVGSTVPPKDVAIAALKAPEAVYKGDTATIEATIKADGLPAGTRLDVTLTGRGGPIRQSVNLEGGVRPVATFRVTLDAAGLAPITVAVTPPSGDAADNDARSTAIQVADDKASVLIVDGEARVGIPLPAERPGARPPRGGRGGDPRAASDAGDGRGHVSGEPPAPADRPVSSRPDRPVRRDRRRRRRPPGRRLVASRGVRRRTRGTLAIVPGPRHWPQASGASEASRDLLPVSDLRRVEPEPGDDPAHPSLPPGAIVAPIRPLDDPGSWPMLQLGSEPSANRAAWASLPRLPWALAGRLKPGATALATTTRDGDDSAVIAAMPYGLGKILWVGTDATWRWRHRVGDAIHHRFWARSSGGRPRGSSARATDSSGSGRPRRGPSPAKASRSRPAWPRPCPTSGPELPDRGGVVKVGSKDAAAVVPLRPVPDRPRLFEGVAPGLPEGSYAIALDVPALADAPAPGRPARSARPRYGRRPRTSERVELAADRDPLDRSPPLPGAGSSRSRMPAGSPPAQGESPHDDPDRGDPALGSPGRPLPLPGDRRRRVDLAQAAGTAVREDHPMLLPGEHRGMKLHALMLIAMLVVAIPLAWWANRLRSRAAAVAAIRGANGQVLFDYQLADGSEKFDSESPVPRWLLRTFGEEAFHDVVSAQLAGAHRIAEALFHIVIFDGLGYLNLNNNTIRNSDLACLGALRELETLSLWDAAITDSGLAHLRALDRLASLSLQGTAVTDAGMAELAKHRDIVNLDLTGMRVTDAALIRLRPLTKLRWLNLEGTAVTDAGLDALLTLRRPRRHLPRGDRRDGCGRLQADGRLPAEAERGDPAGDLAKVGVFLNLMVKSIGKFL